MNQFYKRQSLRLLGWNYSSPGFYYVTICVDKYNDKFLFGDICNGEMYLNKFGQIVQDELLNTEILRDNVRIHDFVVMPNHLHVIVQITYEIGGRTGLNHDGRIRFDCDVRIRRGVLQYAPTNGTKPDTNGTKSKRDTNPANLISPSNTIGAIVRGFKSASTREINILRQTQGERVWQRSYYEHIIRNYCDFIRISEYIQNNQKNWEKDEFNK